MAIESGNKNTHKITEVQIPHGGSLRTEQLKGGIQGLTLESPLVGHEGVIQPSEHVMDQAEASGARQVAGIPSESDTESLGSMPSFPGTRAEQDAARIAWIAKVRSNLGPGKDVLM
jgi:hypothetical protein